MKKNVIKIAALLLCICLLFTGCDSIGTFMGMESDKIEYKVENGEATVISVPNKATITEINIPDEYDGVPVTKLADFSVVNLEYVDKISIGKNVKEIGVWALENNQRVTAFEVDEENEHFCDVDGVLFTKDMKTLLFYPIAKDLVEEKNDEGNIIEVSEYTIPDGVETIRSKAFYKCGNLVTVTIPDSVKKIEEKAFFRCDAVTEIKLPENLEFIGKDAFSYCYGLTEINIPATVNQIDEYAFYNCTALLKVNIDNTQDNLTLGEKWFPTNNGLDIEGLEIIWAD